jgi:hypothetical protein
MVTPTFVFSVTIVTMAVLAFGTTQTYLRFSSSGPGTGCTVTGCAHPDASHTANRTSGGPMTAGSAHRPSPSPGRTSSGTSPRKPQRRPDVRISYRTVRAAPGGFLAEISITGRSDSPDGDWRLSFSYPGVQITWMAGATWREEDGTVVIKPLAETPQLRKGTTLPVMFTATGEPGAPSGCLFEGAHCHISG